MFCNTDCWETRFACSKSTWYEKVRRRRQRGDRHLPSEVAPSTTVVVLIKSEWSSRMNGIRVSIYIVTYKNPVDLNRNIASILASAADVRINVINNHSQFFLEPKYEKAVKVLHNNL